MNPPVHLLPGSSAPPPEPTELVQTGPTPLEWALFGLACVRRHKVAAACAFVLTIAAALAYQSRKEPAYRVEAKLLTQPQALPASMRNAFDDMPTRSAWELVHRRENLLAIAKQAKLASDPALMRTLAARKVSAAGRGASEKDPVELLVTVLDKTLVVNSTEGTVSIELDWPDPRQAYDIVQAALQNFLEARHVQEVVAIDDVVTVLEARASVLRDDYDRAVEQARRRSAPAPQPTAAVPRVVRPSAEIARLRAAIEAKQRAIKDVEDFRLRRLAEVQAQLDQARSSLSDAHPTVIRLRDDIAALAQESPQVAGLKREEADLRKQYAQIAPGAEEPQLGRPAPLPAPSRIEEDQGVREARQSYEQIQSRLNAVLVERDAARAAFKYRYNVIWPPQMPTEPTGPNWKKLLGAAFVAGLLLAGAVSVAPELLAGRILTRWQLERTLKLRVVGELRAK